MLSIWTELLNMSDCNQTSKRSFILRKSRNSIEIPVKIRSKVWCAFIDSIFSFDILDCVSEYLKEPMSAKALLSTVTMRKEGFGKYTDKLKFLASCLARLEGVSSDIYIVFQFLLEEMIDNSVTVLNAVMQDFELTRQLKIFVKESVESVFDNCGISQGQLFIFLDHFFVLGSDFLAFFLLQILKGGLVNDEGKIGEQEKFNSVLLYSIQRYLELKAMETSSDETFNIHKDNSINISSVYNENPRDEVFKENIAAYEEIMNNFHNVKGEIEKEGINEKAKRIPIFSAKKKERSNNISTEIEGDSFTKKSETQNSRTKASTPSRANKSNKLPPKPLISSRSPIISRSRSPTPTHLDSQMHADVEQLFRKYGHKKNQLCKIFDRIASRNTLTKEMEEQKRMSDVKTRLMQVERMTTDLGKIVKESIKFVAPKSNSTNYLRK